jgi:hypothetical protein
VRWDELFSQCVEYDPASTDKPKLPGGGGVYLLTDEVERLIQLASAADLKRAIANRLGWAVATAATPEESGSPVDAAGPEADVADEQRQAGSPPPAEEARAGRSTPTEAAQAGSLPSTEEAQAESPPSAEERGAGKPPPVRRRADLSQIVRRIRWQPAHSAFEITYEYLRIARAVLPDTYLKNVAFGPAWFVHVDPDADIPRFNVTKIIPSGPGSTLGPFATQQDANRFVQALEDVFDLCRYIHILEQAPHGQPCAYYEMGRCPAPCGGLIPMSQYREMMQTAVQFAAGERGAVRGEWESQMRQAAGELAFERAAAIKQRMERARELDHAAYWFVRPVEAFSWLIVQRGGGRTRVMPFFVRAGRLTAGDAVKLKDLETAVPAWIECMRAGECWREALDSGDLQERSEHVWLVSHFLFRREQTGLFFDARPMVAGSPAAALKAETLAECIRERFAATRPEPQA